MMLKWGLFLVSLLLFSSIKVIHSQLSLTDSLVQFDYGFDELDDQVKLDSLRVFEILSKRNSDTLAIVRCASLRARFAIDKSNYEEAFAILRLVDPMVKQSKSELVNATYYLRLGTTVFYHMEETLTHQEAFDEADVLNDSTLSYLGRVILPSVKLHDPLLYFKGCYIKALSLRRVARDKEALEVLNDAESIIRQEKLFKYKLPILNIRASILQEIGREDEANDLYSYAISQAKNEQDEFSLLPLYSNYGAFLYNLQRDNESLRYFMLSDSIAEIVNEEAEYRFITASYIHELNFYLEDHEQAYLWSQKALEYYKEIETEKMRLKFEQMQIETANFENERLAFEHAEKRFEAEKESQKQTRMSILFGSIAIFLLFSVGTIFYFNRLKTKNKSLVYEKQVSELIRQQEIASMESMIEGQESERKRLGRELHDHIGSMLSTLGMHFTSAFEKNTEIDVNENPEASRVLQLLDNTVQETRKLSHDLMTGVLNRFGLVSAIRDLCDQISETGKVNVLLNSVGMEERLDPMIELNVYRISQELISNALKHASPTTIRINLVKKQRTLSLTVKDDGVGMTSEAFNNSKGAGSTNVRGRVASMLGKLEVNDQVEQGTIIKVSIPIKE